MKKWLIFLGGVITGIVLTFLFIYIASESMPKTDTIAEEAKYNEDINFFEKPGDLVKDKSFEVFQVLSDDAALVRALSDARLGLYLGPVYLLTNDEGKFYYDEEKIKAPNGKVFRQVGIYRYPTKNEIIKTVPIIKLMDN